MNRGEAGLHDGQDDIVIQGHVLGHMSLEGVRLGVIFRPKPFVPRDN